MGIFIQNMMRAHNSLIVMDEYLLWDKILIMYFGRIPVAHQLKLMETHYVQEERVIC